ncbi:MAG: sensor histidine kinase, partial [Acidobacteriota bacterium]
FAEREASDLMEFLRGHVMYFHRRGQPDPQVLVNPEITKRIVASFGNITDLKSVAIDLDGLRLDVSIAADGMVAQKIRQTRGTSTPPPFDPTIEKNLLVLATPIYRDDTITGWVQLKESVAGMNRSIARQIMIIFSAFTVTVTLSGILIGIIVTQADTTIRKQYGELAETHKRLLQAAKLAALGEMAGGVAHEINNPLGIILGRADYLSSLDGRRKLADCQEDLEVIQRNAARAGKIISDLLDFARPHPLDSQEQDLNELLSETVGFMEPRIRSSHLKIRKELSPLPPVQVDRDRMQQVFVNLINNAIDASPENGTIRLRTRADRSNSLLEVSIEDNGVGMPEEQLKKVFDPFFTTKPQGTGLGLSVSYTIVREHGGQILADSQPGRGTRFRVTLPADRGRAES